MQSARANGYRGEWPPKPVTVRSETDLQRVLKDLDAGQLRAANVEAAARHITCYFGSMKPEDFRKLGELFLEIVLFDELSKERRDRFFQVPSVRVRLRAVQGILKPILEVLRLVPLLQKKHASETQELRNLLDHLCRCQYAFLSVFEGETMERVSAKLFQLAQGTCADTALRAARTALSMISTALKALMETAAEIDKSERKQVTDKRLAQVERELKQINARVAKKLSNAKRGPEEDAGDE